VGVDVRDLSAGTGARQNFVRGTTPPTNRLWPMAAVGVAKGLPGFGPGKAGRPTATVCMALVRC
jgi:hypothetical protein